MIYLSLPLTIESHNCRKNSFLFKLKSSPKLPVKYRVTLPFNASLYYRFETTSAVSCMIMDRVIKHLSINSGSVELGQMKSNPATVPLRISAGTIVFTITNVRTPWINLSYQKASLGQFHNLFPTTAHDSAILHMIV